MSSSSDVRWARIPREKNTIVFSRLPIGIWFKATFFFPRINRWMCRNVHCTLPNHGSMVESWSKGRKFGDLSLWDLYSDPERSRFFSRRRKRWFFACRATERRERRRCFVLENLRSRLARANSKFQHKRLLGRRLSRVGNGCWCRRPAWCTDIVVFIYTSENC